MSHSCLLYTSVQLLHHLVVIRSHGTELGVESGQLRHVFERSPVGLYPVSYTHLHPFVTHAQNLGPQLDVLKRSRPRERERNVPFQQARTIRRTREWFWGQRGAGEIGAVFCQTRACVAYQPAAFVAKMGILWYIEGK